MKRLEALISLRIPVRMLAFVKAEAKKNGISASKWLRKLIEREMQQGRCSPLQPVSPDKEAALAKVLYLLGRTRIPNNLNQIARDLNTGTYIDSPDAHHKMNEAYNMVRWMKSQLMIALGIKEK
jgi:hypothetical protein